MSRLTSQDYLYIARTLRIIWLHDAAAFAAVLSADQWRVHDFFRPSEKLTDKERLEHRHQISKERPTLPAQAGRASARIRREAIARITYRERLAQNPELLPRPRTQTPYNVGRNIKVGAVVKPKLDTKKVARALLDLARDPEFRTWWDQSHNEDGSWKEEAKNQKLPKYRYPKKPKDDA